MAIVLPIVLKSGEFQRLQAGDQVGITVVDDNSTNATMYPVWVDGSSGNRAPMVSSTKLTFNPSTGILTTGFFVGTAITSSSGSYNQPNFFNPVSGDTNWAYGIFNSGSNYWMQVKYAEAGDGLRGFRVFDTNANQVVFSASRTQLYTLGGLAVGASIFPSVGNIGLMAIPTTALNTNFAGLIIANSSISADNTIGISKRLFISQNTIQNSSNIWKYISSDAASLYEQISGIHSFYTIASGTAGNTATLIPTFEINIDRVSTSFPFNLKNYTVVTLPLALQGDVAYVTDALAPGFLTIVVGGGSTRTPVFFNGTNWVAF